MKPILMMLIAGFSPWVYAASADLWSVGHGFSQGGLLGVQYQSIHDDDKATIALGLVGASVGWQHVIDDNRHHALGLSTGYEAITSDKGFLGATYHYYPAGFGSRGWHFGLFAGIGRESNDFLFIDFGRNQPQARTRAIAALEIGFQY